MIILQVNLFSDKTLCRMYMYLLDDDAVDRRVLTFVDGGTKRGATTPRTGVDIKIIAPVTETNKQTKMF